MLKFCCIIAILGSAFLASRLYREYKKRVVLELDAYCDMLKDLHRCLSLYGISIKKWADAYNNPLLEALGLIPSLRGGEPLPSAFSEAVRLGNLPKSGIEAMRRSFLGFGRGSIKEEAANVERVYLELEQIRKNEMEAAGKSVRAVTAILLGVGCGAVILLL